MVLVWCLLCLLPSLFHELRVAPIFEEQLEMFCIKSKLVNGFANFICRGSIGRSARPTVSAAGVFELEVAAIIKMQYAVSESRIDFVSNEFCLGILGEVHDPRLTKLGR